MMQQLSAAHDFLAAARGLAPMVQSLRDRFDHEQQLPRELVTAVGAAGLFGMWLPCALGGPELDPIDFLTVIEELARLDGSLGWCTAIPAGYGRLAGAMAESVASRIFGSGQSVLVGTLKPTGKAVAERKGYRVSGRWSYGSFIGYSQWVLGNCITHDDAQPRRDASGLSELRICIFPREQVEVFDVRHVGGLRATGSSDYLVNEVFVPEEWTIPIRGFIPPRHQPGSLYGTSLTSTVVSCIAAVALGIARAATETLGELAGKKILRPRVIAQVDVARAEALVSSGRAFLFDEVRKLWKGTQDGSSASPESRALVRLAADQVTQNSIEAVDLMYKLAGGVGPEGNRLERCFRDVHAVGQHIAVAMSEYLT